MTAFPLDVETARRMLPDLAGLDDAALLHRYARAVWSCLVEPGDGDAGRLVAALGATVALREVITGARDDAAADAAEIDRRAYGAALRRWRPRLSEDTVRVALAAAARTGTRLLVPDDDLWPERLDDLGPHAPLCLWVRGDPADLRRSRPAIAIVGARAATGYGEHVAMELSGELSADGAVVVSGGAYGIDGAAHRAALAVGGVTAALLAGGVDRPYPAGHARLLERIADAGVLAAEVPCGSTPTKWRFLQRNRLIAALADAVVVVEAGARSGSLNTASHASTLGRPLGAVPGPVTSAASAGCHRMLREQDARCIRDADDVRELAGLAMRAAPAAAGDRTDERTRVRDALSARVGRTPAQLASQAGMAPEEVAEILGLLSLEGSADLGHDGWRLAPARR